MDPNFKCFRVPAPTEPVTDSSTKILDEMVEWLHEHDADSWEGDDSGITIYHTKSYLDEDNTELCNPGDWITSIPSDNHESGRRLVRLPRTARTMRVCQMADDTEKELWVWELPNGQAVYLFDGREPQLTTLSVDKDSNRGVWLPGEKK